MPNLRNIAHRHPWLLTIYKILAAFPRYWKFTADYAKFKSLSNSKRFAISWQDRYPCLEDQSNTTEFDRHYVLHTAWAARILSKTRPQEHVDISSYLYFATLVSAFIPVRFYDYRPAKINLPGLATGSADLTKLSFADNSISSLSCMHVVEHIGLGRYGDPLDPEGDLKAINELKRTLAKGGDLLFVVPLGQGKIMFNAHRIYTFDQIKEYFSGLNLIEFSLIPEDAADGELIKNPTKELLAKQGYGCGCFWFRKERE